MLKNLMTLLFSTRGEISKIDFIIGILASILFSTALCFIGLCVATVLCFLLSFIFSDMDTINLDVLSYFKAIMSTPSVLEDFYSLVRSMMYASWVCLLIKVIPRHILRSIIYKIDPEILEADS